MKNRVAKAIDISYFFDNFNDYFFKPLPLSTFLDQDVKYIDKNDGKVKLKVENGKLMLFNRERKIDYIDEEQRTITTKRLAWDGSIYTFGFDKSRKVIDRFRSTKSVSKASGFFYKRNLAVHYIREDEPLMKKHRIW